MAALCAALWLLMPEKHPEPGKYLPSLRSASISLSLEGQAHLVSEALKKFSPASAPGSIVSRPFLIKYLLPVRLSAGVTVNDRQFRNIPYTVIADPGRKAKIFRLVWGIMLEKIGGVETDLYKSTKIAVFKSGDKDICLAFTGSLFAASTDRKTLEGVLDSLSKGGGSENGEDTFFKRAGEENYDLAAAVSNRQGLLTGLVRDAEERNAYSIFPSMHNVSSVNIGLAFRDLDRLRGEIEFALGKTGAAPAEEVLNDVRFLDGLLKRAARGRRLKYASGSGSSSDRVFLDIELGGLEKLPAELKKKG